MQIRRLEATLHVQLFTRNTRQVALTAAGEELLTETREILGLFGRTLNAVQSRSDAEQGVLRLGWIIPLRDQLMARLVRSFEADTGVHERGLAERLGSNAALHASHFSWDDNSAAATLDAYLQAQRNFARG